MCYHTNMNTDLAIAVDDTTLNIRVAVIIKTKGGEYIFEKRADLYLFVLGGRIKINESSIDAAQREIEEELGIKINRLNPRAVIENFFINNSEKVHEICFVYESIDTYDDVLPSEFVSIADNALDNYDIRPKAIVDILKDKTQGFRHIVIK